MSDGAFCHYCQTRPCKCGSGRTEQLTAEELAKWKKWAEGGVVGLTIDNRQLRQFVAAAEEAERLRAEIADHRDAWDEYDGSLVLEFNEKLWRQLQPAR